MVPIILAFLLFLIGSTDCRVARRANGDAMMLPSGEKPTPSIKFTVEPSTSTTTTLGSSVTLYCNGTGTLGPPSISWLFTPEINSDVSKTWEPKNGGTSGTLILGNLQKSEGGYYFCQLTDGYGYRIISRGALIVVTYLDAEFRQFPVAQTITSSKSFIKLPCRAPNSNPVASINWYKDDTLIEKVSNMFQEYRDGDTFGSLVIFNPTISDSGEYSCEAVNMLANPEKRKTTPALIEIQVDGTGSYTQKFVSDHYIMVKKGEDAVLRAGAIGYPEPSYTWTLGLSAVVDISPGSRFSTADFGRELRITNVKVEDRGTYWCQYKNTYNPTGAVSVVRLYVQEDIVFDTVLTAQTVEHITPLTFDCQCSGTPFTSGDPTAPPSVMWLRDGVSIVDGDRFKEEDGNLIVSGLEMSEAGMYQCFCYNTKEIIQGSMPVSVKNMTIPVSIDGKSIAEGVYGEPIDIVCRANGYPLPVVTWFWDNLEITANYDPRYSIDQTNANDYVISTLTVLSVKGSDAGMLTCRAVNKKMSTYVAELEIDFVVGNKVAPSITLSDIDILLNSAITLEAVASGYPFPAITWYKDTVEINTRDRYTVSGTVLFIDGTQSSDTGLYVVRASNGVGEDAYANATISLGSNSAVIIMGSTGGAVAVLFIVLILILLYVLFRQKQKQNYVPPVETKTPHEEEIENRIWNNQSPVSCDGFRPKSDSLEDKKNSSIYLNPVLSTHIDPKGRALPPIDSSGRPPIMQGVYRSRDRGASTISTSESTDDSDDSSFNSQNRIVKKQHKKSRIAPMK